MHTHTHTSQGGVGAVYMQRSSNDTSASAAASGSLWQTVSATVDVIVNAASGARSATSTVLMEGFSPIDALGASGAGRYLAAAWASAGRNARAALQLPPYSITARAYQLAPETLEVAPVGEPVPPIVLARGIVQDNGYKRGSQFRLWCGLAAGESLFN
jgi:hypothetical protein